MLIAAGPPAEAGKKRRDASLDELKQRSPAERWKSLQRFWQSDNPSPDVPPQELTPAPAAASPSLLKKTAIGDAEHAASVEAPVSQSAPQDVHANTDANWETEESRTELDARQSAVEGTTDVSYLQNAEEDAMSMDGIDSSRPKPITSILPYYDYTPGGEDPCNFLCPRPEDCAEDKLKKPCPELVELPDVPFEERTFADSYVSWEASNLFSNPLYFEDASLERYGHTHNCVVQPFVSVGKFGVQLVGLPYQMALHPICERRYALGWYRPGECAPYKYYLPPWNTKAAITAGAVYTGLFYLIP